MTEEQAIERIAGALAKGHNDDLWLADDDERASTVDDWRAEAQAAWDEMKAIAIENPARPIPVREVPPAPWAFDVDSP